MRPMLSGGSADDKLTFGTHIAKTRNKAIKTTIPLAKIMPNNGGPKSFIRKLICNKYYMLQQFYPLQWNKAAEKEIL